MPFLRAAWLNKKSKPAKEEENFEELEVVTQRRGYENPFLVKQEPLAESIEEAETVEEKSNVVENLHKLLDKKEEEISEEQLEIHEPEPSTEEADLITTPPPSLSSGTSPYTGEAREAVETEEDSEPVEQEQESLVEEQEPLTEEEQAEALVEESEPSIEEEQAEALVEEPEPIPDEEPAPEEFKLMYDVTSGERYVDKVSTKTEFDKVLDELTAISKDLLSWQTEKFAKQYTEKFQDEKTEADARKYEAFLGGYITNAAMTLYDNGYGDIAIKQLDQAKSILEARRKLETETQAIKDRVEEEDALVDLSDILGMFGDG